MHINLAATMDTNYQYHNCWINEIKVDKLYMVSKGRTMERAFRRPNGDGGSGIKPQSRTKNQLSCDTVSFTPRSHELNKHDIRLCSHDDDTL